MDRDAEDHHEKRRRWRRILISVLLPVALLAGSVAVFHRTALRGEAAAIDAAHRAGFPVTRKELMAWHEQRATPGDVSAAYRPAFIAMHVPGTLNDLDFDELPLIGAAPWPELDQSVSSHSLAQLAAIVTYNQEAIDLLHKAAKQRGHFAEKTAGERDDRFSRLDLSIRILFGEALLHIEEDRPTEAARAIEAALAAMATVQEEPFTPFGFRRSWPDFGAKGVRRLLTRASAPPEALAALQARIEQVECSPTPPLPVMEHIAYADDMIEGLCEEGASKSGGMIVGRLVSWNLPTLPAFLVEAAFCRAYSLTGMDHRDRESVIRESLAAAQSMSNQATAFPSAPSPTPPWYCVVTSIYDPSTIPVVQNVSRTIPLASLTTAKTALAVERYRLERSGLPETLDALVPQYLSAVPVDPVDGAPLRYARFPDRRYTVYSIGMNQRDDGGNGALDGTAQPLDVVCP